MEIDVTERFFHFGRFLKKFISFMLIVSMFSFLFLSLFTFHAISSLSFFKKSRCFGIVLLFFLVFRGKVLILWQRCLLETALLLHDSTHELLEQVLLLGVDLGHVVGSFILDVGFKSLKSKFTAIYF